MCWLSIDIGWGQLMMWDLALGALWLPWQPQVSAPITTLHNIVHAWHLYIMCKLQIWLNNNVARATEISRKPPQGYSSWRHWADSDHPQRKVSDRGKHAYPFGIIILMLFCSPQYIDIPNINGASPLMSACSLGKKEWAKSKPNNNLQNFYLISRLVWWNCC